MGDTTSLEMNIMKLVLLTAIAMTVASTSENSIVEEVFLGDDHAPTTDQDPGRPKITTMALQPPKATVDATPREAAFNEASNNQDSDDADNAIIPEASSPAGKQGEAAASISKTVAVQDEATLVQLYTREQGSFAHHLERRIGEDPAAT